MTIQQAQQQLRVELQLIYDPREAANIANWVMESVTGLERMERLIHQYDPLSAAQEATLAGYTTALLDHVPVQYVLHESWFYGLKLYVDEHVLIPRPETEELVHWIVSEQDPGAIQSRFTNFDVIPLTAAQVLPTSDFLPAPPHVKDFRFPHVRILDIGTGSGCIPIALKKSLPASEVHACDVSAGALQVARKNGDTHEAAIEWRQVDFLRTYDWDLLPRVDIIVSNPPYIPVKDKATMHDNVLRHEPHLALFVADDDPLLFYRHIARFGQQKLLPGGSIYVEIHEDLGAATEAVFRQYGFEDTVVKKDMQGKDRMVRARR
jgi:release factor glutamine methyltransferase